MSGEFGHASGICGGVCFDGWGAGPFSIQIGDKTYRFEDSERFGPALLRKNGELLDNPYPGERSPFWKAHRAWLKQGRRTKDGSICIFDPPKPTKYRRIGRTCVVIEHGDEDGDFIEVKPFSSLTKDSRDDIA